MAIRNWWIDTQVDGQVRHKGTGPSAKGGGFITTILQRDGGKVTRAATISGYALSSGELKLELAANCEIRDIKVLDGGLTLLIRTVR